MSNVTNEAKAYLNKKMLFEVLGKSLKTHIIAKNININGVQSGLINLLASNDFKKINSKWIPSIRLENINATLEKVIGDVLTAYGSVLEYEKIFAEVSETFQNDLNLKDKIKKHLSNPQKYFSIDNKYGLCDWLLTPYPNAEEVIFQNYLSKEEIEFHRNIFEKADWLKQEYAKNIIKIINSSDNGKIPLSIVFFFIWEVEGDFFDPIIIFESIENSDEITIMPDGFIYGSKSIKSFEKELQKEQKRIGDSEIEPLSEEDIALKEEKICEIIKEILDSKFCDINSVAKNIYKEEDLKDNFELIKNYLIKIVKDSRIDTDGNQWFVKVSFEESDIEDIVEYINEKETVTSEEIISSILDIPSSHSKFKELKDELESILANITSVVFMGNDTWMKPLEIPDDIKTIPPSLIYENPEPVEDMEGEMFDQEIDIDGFEGTLKSDIYNSLVEDYNDEDCDKTIYNVDNKNKQKCVLKYHHKMAGTFPLCQINPDFFDCAADIFPVIISGKTIFVNKNTRLIYNMEDFYANISEISGAIFYIEKTDIPNGYNFVYNEEAEKTCAIDLNRSLELLELKGKFENENLTVFDVIREILERKPISFAHLVTEVNIVVRCKRLLIASILSSYHCFNPKGKTGLWAFDEKKIDQGFNKTKKKYILK